MNRYYLGRAVGGMVIMMALLGLSACQSEAPVETTESHLMQKTEELFTRIKVRDYAVIWENEFPYMREESPLEEYLNNAYMKWYNADTLSAVQVDSVTLWEDTAYVHMALEWLRADSTFDVNIIRLRWHYAGEEWLKPTLSLLDKQLEFEEELRVYWEAVEKMQKKQEEDSEPESDDN